ncbi:hypothetical protein BOTBODRAFT_243047 [Botryobasidium botryosum FD-172 SS1]|uniref:Membrane-associated protein n=1 Tax=Botryobasidium botryosum (strain FD-172 SS1) TaxID=930990 RepID=A0A067LTU9_BOTB1|nr:hypothetical protein BOTBODRAFT_243047 [Botryobasidium botryosum FD-172 SS1]
MINSTLLAAVHLAIALYPFFAYAVVTNVVEGNITNAVGSNADCFPKFSWMNNGLMQSPCLVSAYASSSCAAMGDFVIESLDDPMVPYPPPNTTRPSASSRSINACTCSSVGYQLISACGVCQGVTNVLTWSTWHANCPDALVNVKVYPFPVPSRTAFPAWALLDPSTSNIFDVQAAQSVSASGLPDVPAGVTPTVVPFPAMFLTSTGTLSRSATSSPTNSMTPSSSAIPQHASTSAVNLVIIVGSVVGGVTLVVLAAYLTLFCARRRRQAAADEARGSHPHAYTLPMLSPGPIASPVGVYSAPPMGSDGELEMLYSGIPRLTHSGSPHYYHRVQQAYKVPPPPSPPPSYPGSTGNHNHTHSGSP